MGMPTASKSSPARASAVVTVQLREFDFQIGDLHALGFAHLGEAIDAVAFLLHGPESGVTHDDRVHRRVILECELVLAQFADALTIVDRDIASGRLQIAAHDLHQRGLATAVGADQPVTVAAAEFDRDVFEQGLGPELHGDIGCG